MQGPQRNPGQMPPVKIYNAVYSSVQVYECMVRGIAVMRRRGDSYVNATQILKVAGIEKGRRTKILEKEVLPGKHEIVQGGYGKYQGTWIPLDRGREIAAQFGVAPLLAPLFDFTPTTNSLGSLPATNNAPPQRPISSSSSFSGIGTSQTYSQSSLPPPPIMPGSALRLLAQGRAQGLFTPSTSAEVSSKSTVYPPSSYQYNYVQPPAVSSVPSTQQALKRARSDSEVIAAAQTGSRSSVPQRSSHPLLEAPADIQMVDRSQQSPHASQSLEDDGPSPNKRARRETSPPRHDASQSQPLTSSSQSITQSLTRHISSMNVSSPKLQSQNGSSRAPSVAISTNGKMLNGADNESHALRFSTKPPPLRDPSMLRDPRHAQVIAAVCREDDPAPVLQLLHELTPDPSHPVQVDTVLDDKGHTALHLAASMSRQNVVSQLVTAGADVHRGNFAGETPLMRASIDTHNFDRQNFHSIVASLHHSIRTIDTSKKTVLHHIMYLAGIQGRATQHQGGDFKSIVDLQDEHGDTALNIAARVGNRSLVKTLLDVGANRLLPNKLGLRPGDFGVEVEELSGGPRAEDLLSSLRPGPLAPVQKSQDIITEITTMIQGLSAEFSSEIKAKQDSLDLTQAHLRAATRELSEQRRQIQMWQSRCAELDQVHQRIRNLEKAAAEEDNFDWTGRTDLTGRDGRETGGSAFQWRGTNSTMAGAAGSMDIPFSVEMEPPIPATDSVASLIRLRRLKTWHVRMEELMEERLKSLQGASAEKEYQCKRIVALCTGIPIEKVEDMLENLVVAMESEAQVVDIVRVSGFMQKVRDGVI
ncbi:apses-domain-containing protein [Pisolithus orientalis]|uniref:apses-domain-containing protein n=1 Tax=Pisolithus orientalis TaxID=936130 RepID=UPI002224AA77|nr:apses-domain-containing protein [Pisolithus orientalis]KAI5999332.1 apses-domain-containing protein [Pisolithus orientalis]